MGLLFWIFPRVDIGIGATGHELVVPDEKSGGDANLGCREDGLEGHSVRWAVIIALSRNTRV